MNSNGCLDIGTEGVKYIDYTFRHRSSSLILGIIYALCAITFLIVIINFYTRY